MLRAPRRLVADLREQVGVRRDHAAAQAGEERGGADALELQPAAAVAARRDVVVAHEHATRVLCDWERESRARILGAAIAPAAESPTHDAAMGVAATGKTLGCDLWRGRALSIFGAQRNLQAPAISNIYARTLQKAAEHLGGTRALARYLGVPMPELFSWMKPDGPKPPNAVFFKAVDIVLDDIPEDLQARHQRVRLAALRDSKRQPKS
jgi:hypothetical protein